MSGNTVAEVDELVAAIGPELDAPVIIRRDVVLVTGPWMAGVTGVATVLHERLPEHTFVESADLRPGEAPKAVVFVVSAAAQLTDSDCALLAAAAEHTDVVIPVVSKIDVHRGWSEILTANRRALAAHAPRYAQVPWVGVAAVPELGDQQVDELVGTVAAQLGASDVERRNRLRAWESRLQTVARRFDRDADGAGRRARVDALREERSTAVRERRQAKSARTITLRSQIQQAKVQLSHHGLNRCSAMRGELQEEAARLPRRGMAGFEARARARAAEVVTEVAEHTTAHLVDLAAGVDVPVELPPPAALSTDLPSVNVASPPLKSRRQETWLMLLLGAGFGVGVAVALGRLVAGVAQRLNSAVEVVGGIACVAVGLAVTFLVVNLRALLHDRALLDRWAGDLTSSLRSVVEELVATRVLAAESLLTTGLLAQEEIENAQVAERVGAIDTELREHAIAAARAAAARDREMPTIQAALDAVRAELGEAGIPQCDDPADDVEGLEIARSASRSIYDGNP
ncbi:hypothetical protein [Mycobacterium simiae]|uniref:hypothetical protein n=1 Tax=Mycobacterium simiae TaxID=1784 RepID=UPI0005C97878|nr:hypothetical protein [Mycobacterium simiae]PLV52025.1 hypothetical protein X011_10980 [Mycobacterium tuberculosis variant microti OV254]BBX40624.1 hypothetical protein MSIM_20750 [Mycobacterium simiae]